MTITDRVTGVASATRNDARQVRAESFFLEWNWGVRNLWNTPSVFKQNQSGAARNITLRNTLFKVRNESSFLKIASRYICVGKDCVTGAGDVSVQARSGLRLQSVDVVDHFLEAGAIGEVDNGSATLSSFAFISALCNGVVEGRGAWHVVPWDVVIAQVGVA